MLENIIFTSVLAGILASLACGLGALPLAWKHIDPSRRSGVAYAFAGGLMLSASVYNLILPSLTMNSHAQSPGAVFPVLAGLLLGAGFISVLERYMDGSADEHAHLFKSGGRQALLIFAAMFVHSIPEGVAIGVGYTSETVVDTKLGHYLALAIALHNIPEGLAVAVPLRAGGAKISTCFWLATLTSIPQPIASIPACMASWFFHPLMPFLMAFAAGAMIYLILIELIPSAYKTESANTVGWSFMLGFMGMLLIQLVL